MVHIFMEIIKLEPDLVVLKERNAQRAVYCDVLHNVFPKKLGKMTDLVVKMGFLTPYQFQIYQVCNNHFNLSQIARIFPGGVSRVLNTINFLIRHGCVKVEYTPEQTRQIMPSSADISEQNSLISVD